MFTTIDWGLIQRDREALAQMTPEERSVFEAKRAFERRAPQIVRSEADRDRLSSDLVIGVLNEAPSIGSDGAGYQRVRLSLQDQSGARFRNAVYVSSGAESIDTVERRALTEKLMAMEPGQTVSMLGRWQDRSWRNAAGERVGVTEFRAQRLAIGTTTREQLMARLPGGEVERAEAYMTDLRARQEAAALSLEVLDRVRRGPSAETYREFQPLKLGCERG